VEARFLTGSAATTTNGVGTTSGVGTANGTEVIIWICKAAADQQRTLRT
jgi:hypothetical protein